MIDVTTTNYPSFLFFSMHLSLPHPYTLSSFLRLRFRSVPRSTFPASAFLPSIPSSLFICHVSSVLPDFPHAFSPRSNNMILFPPCSFIPASLASSIPLFPPSLGPSFPSDFWSQQRKIKRQAPMPRSLKASTCLGGTREAITIFRGGV